MMRLRPARIKIVITVVILVALLRNFAMVTPGREATGREESVIRSAHSESNKKIRNPDDPRPQGLRLVLLGDSLTRYQYLSLVYFLMSGHWWDPAKRDPHLVEERTFGSTFQAFFEGSTSILNPYERCDCHRPEGNMNKFLDNVTENRYFWEPEEDNIVVFLNALGHHAHPHGRYTPQEALHDISSFQYSHNNFSKSQFKWMTGEWDWIVREYIAKLDPPMTHVVANAGLWPNQFRYNETARTDLADAMHQANLTSIWKTTTFRMKSGRVRGTESSDVAMCGLFKYCLDVQWTGKLNPEYHADPAHFVEPIYRVMNEQLLEMMGHTWPSNYTKTNLTHYTI